MSEVLPRVSGGPLHLPAQQSCAVNRKPSRRRRNNAGCAARRGLSPWCGRMRYRTRSIPPVEMAILAGIMSRSAEDACTRVLVDEADIVSVPAIAASPSGAPTAHHLTTQRDPQKAIVSRGRDDEMLSIPGHIMSVGQFVDSQIM